MKHRLLLEVFGREQWLFVVRLPDRALYSIRKSINVFPSKTLLNDSFSVVIANASTQFLIIHCRFVFNCTPSTSHLYWFLPVLMTSTWMIIHITSSGSMSLNSHPLPVHVMHWWHLRSISDSNKNFHKQIGAHPLKCGITHCEQHSLEFNSIAAWGESYQWMTKIFAKLIVSGSSLNGSALNDSITTFNCFFYLSLKSISWHNRNIQGKGGKSCVIVIEESICTTSICQFLIAFN